MSQPKWLELLNENKSLNLKTIEDSDCSEMIKQEFSDDFFKNIDKLVK